MSPTRTQIRDSIAVIAANKASGAAELLSSAAQVFLLLERDASTPQIIEVCVGLVRAQPLMAPFVSLSNAVANAIGNNDELAGEAAANAAAKFDTRVRSACHLAVQHAANLIQDESVVLTHSRSSTVLEAIIAASDQGKRVRVIATESRPLMEGRTLASELANRSIEITLIADAAAGVALEHANLCLLGADRITPRYVVNKIGTRMIVLAAVDRAVPAYVVCDESKFTASDEINLLLGEEAGDELWSNPTRGVRISNLLFETVELKPFAGVVTERGVLDVAAAKKAAEAQEIHPLLAVALSNQ